MKKNGPEVGTHTSEPFFFYLVQRLFLSVEGLYAYLLAAAELTDLHHDAFCFGANSHALHVIVFRIDNLVGVHILYR